MVLEKIPEKVYAIYGERNQQEYKNIIKVLSL